MPRTRPTTARREVMGGLAKGLEVILSFTREQPTLTLSQVAAATGLAAATARRCLHTLEELGYVARSGPHVPAASRRCSSWGRRTSSR